MTAPRDPAGFARHCLNTFTHFVPASVAAFYRIDDQLQAHDFHLLHMQPGMHTDYLNHYRHLDPLQPQTCQAIGLPVVPLRTGQAHRSDADNRQYLGFLRQHRVIDVVEVIARTGNRPIAGLSLLRHEGLPAFEPTELASLGALHGLMQAGAEHLAPLPPTLPELTPREREIALLLRDGLGNKALARHLDLGLPTVKTHLLNLFRKVGARNRTELVGMLFLQGD
ncbi:helix-turn-helix transcriptional regulator [Metapseudomonas otitidis]|uniref:helix-turn-helix transcriptional regulator n=1 Tax=Metapseudomonas otitidis TaxID=319939 RepID=UPI00280BD587|nr:helix-turn-helix transcriptional regulator [Pseudomonas otitidis]